MLGVHGPHLKQQGPGKQASSVQGLFSLPYPQRTQLICFLVYLAVRCLHWMYAEWYMPFTHLVHRYLPWNLHFTLLFPIVAVACRQPGILECHVEDGRASASLGHWKIWSSPPPHCQVDFKGNRNFSCLKPLKFGALTAIVASILLTNMFATFQMRKLRSRTVKWSF